MRFGIADIDNQHWGRLPIRRQHYADLVDSDSNIHTHADRWERDLLKVTPDVGCAAGRAYLVSLGKDPDSCRCVECPLYPGPCVEDSRPEGKSLKARW